MAEQVMIDAMKPTDWDQVRAIFIEGIEGGNATFRTTPPTWEQWDAGHLNECRFVARVDGEIVGWIALSPFSNNTFHKGVTEDSIYISNRAQGMGVGTKLLKNVSKKVKRVVFGQSRHKFSLRMPRAYIYIRNSASGRLAYANALVS